MGFLSGSKEFRDYTQIKDDLKISQSFPDFSCYNANTMFNSPRFANNNDNNDNDDPRVVGRSFAG
jgi:hypothetical protein